MSREQAGHGRAANEPRDPVRPRGPEYHADPRDDDSLEEPEQRAGEENQRRQRNAKRRHDGEAGDVQWADPRHAMQAVHEPAKAATREECEVAKPPGDEAGGAKDHDQNGDPDEKPSPETSAVFGRSTHRRRRVRRRHRAHKGKARAKTRPVEPGARSAWHTYPLG